jgi:hypothetical protein
VNRKKKADPVPVRSKKKAEEGPEKMKREGRTGEKNKRTQRQKNPHLMPCLLVLRSHYSPHLLLASVLKKKKKDMR